MCKPSVQNTLMTLCGICNQSVQYIIMLNMKPSVHKTLLILCRICKLCVQNTMNIIC